MKLSYFYTFLILAFFQVNFGFADPSEITNVVLEHNKNHDATQEYRTIMDSSINEQNVAKYYKLSDIFASPTPNQLVIVRGKLVQSLNNKDLFVFQDNNIISNILISPDLWKKINEKTYVLNKDIQFLAKININQDNQSIILQAIKIFEKPSNTENYILTTEDKERNKQLNNKIALSLNNLPNSFRTIADTSTENNSTSTQSSNPIKSNSVENSPASNNSTNDTSTSSNPASNNSTNSTSTSNNPVNNNSTNSTSTSNNPASNNSTNNASTSNNPASNSSASENDEDYDSVEDDQNKPQENPYLSSVKPIETPKFTGGKTERSTPSSGTQQTVGNSSSANKEDTLPKTGTPQGTNNPVDKTSEDKINSNTAKIEEEITIKDNSDEESNSSEFSSQSEEDLTDEIPSQKISPEDIKNKVPAEQTLYSRSTKHEDYNVLQPEELERAKRNDSNNSSSNKESQKRKFSFFGLFD